VEIKPISSIAYVFILMPDTSSLIKKIRRVTPKNFDTLALEVFQYQALENPVYRRYLELLGATTKAVNNIEAIPFLPIQLFKNHTIKTGEWTPQTTFMSSGTTGQQTSQHLVRDRAFYQNNALRGFEYFYGPVSQYCVLALLPSYLERSGSSLVDMVDFFIRESQYSQSGFFLNNLDELLVILRKNQRKQIPTLLIGVSFALLDLAEKTIEDFSNIIVMETGGMKGRRKEMIRTELHKILCKSFNINKIHSEYGMTELLSQAYSQGGKKATFKGAPTLRALARDISDPFAYVAHGRTGGLNIIDLANVDTCSFIATDDLGRVYADGRFEVLGRFDNSDVRGCNLMVF